MQDLLKELGYLAIVTRFRRISEKLYPDGDRIYRDAGLDFKASWFTVFYVLIKSGKAMTVMEIAKQIDFSHITVKNLVRELEVAELVLITPNPADKRSILISLSPKGTEMVSLLEPLWLSFSQGLQSLFEAGHPDFINILNRVDAEISQQPLHQRINQTDTPVIKVIDYRPELKSYFRQFGEKWLLSLFGELEEEDHFTLKHPEKAYLEKGGFVFFASYNNKIVGCVALKRIDKHDFEFVKLFTDPEYRNHGIAKKLIERCITRCKENNGHSLWLQTAHRLIEAQKLYQKLGFEEAPAPTGMQTLKRTERIMMIRL